MKFKVKHHHRANAVIILHLKIFDRTLIIKVKDQLLANICHGCFVIDILHMKLHFLLSINHMEQNVTFTFKIKVIMQVHS